MSDETKIEPGPDAPPKIEDVLDELGRLSVQLEAVFETVKQLVGAANHSAVILSCVEQFLDARFKGWDRGVRQEMEGRAQGLQDRAALLHEAQEVQRSGNPAQIANVAHRLWDLAKRLGTQAQDAAGAVALYLKARDLRHAAELLEEIKGLELPEPVRGLLNELGARMGDLMAEHNSLGELEAEVIPLPTPGGESAE